MLFWPCQFLDRWFCDAFSAAHGDAAQRCRPEMHRGVALPTISHAEQESV
jgi:hypothetical protein